MSKDDDVPKKLQNDFLHQMYEDFGTIEEDCFTTGWKMESTMKALRKDR